MAGKFETTFERTVDCGGGKVVHVTRATAEDGTEVVGLRLFGRVIAFRPQYGDAIIAALTAALDADVPAPAPKRGRKPAAARKPAARERKPAPASEDPLAALAMLPPDILDAIRAAVVSD